MFDITVHRDATGWAFVPHSERADAFVFAQFGLIGDRDLNADDVALIVQRAKARGFKVEQR
jgi:hypothetical protein